MNSSYVSYSRRPLGRCSAARCIVLACVCVAWRSAGAQTTYGTLSNFDVFNNTGQECHGFEIELDGVSSSSISFTFGSPYQRYGNPSVVDFDGGVYVRYESPYDPATQTFTQTTPMAPSVITPTNGHACWTFGSADYLTSGCEHFGLGVNGNPTNTAYRWLVADPTTPGALRASDTKVSIPAPVWNVLPPPQGGGNPVVQAVLPAEPPEVNRQYGDAMWVKVFVTESAEPVELHHLVTDDPAVPQEQSETEVEWVILQAGPNGAANNELVNEGQIGAGKQSVTRRYEFYEYTGAYDPESHEALCGGGQGGVAAVHPRRGGGCDVPLPDELGNYIGAQMAAVNLGVLEAPTETPTLAPTPTPSPNPCAGSCNGDNSVTIDQIIILVNIALGSGQVSDCPSGIPPGASVDVTLIIQAVNNALSGCVRS